MFTNGSSSALELCCATFTNPGDTVIIENPVCIIIICNLSQEAYAAYISTSNLISMNTCRYFQTYFLAKGVFHDHKLNIVAVSTDDQGIVLEKLKDALRTNANAKLLYLVTTFNNPTSATLTLDRRRELAQLCTEYPDLTVICDDVYQLLHFGVSPPPVMPHFYDKAISIGSFSKILAPGLRYDNKGVLCMSKTLLSLTLSAFYFYFAVAGLAGLDGFMRVQRSLCALPCAGIL